MQCPNTNAAGAPPSAPHPPRARRAAAGWCTISAAIALPALLVLACSNDDGNPASPGDDNAPLTTADFAGAASCRECHPDHVDQWEGSMHAYSMHDPIWFAVLQAEYAATNGAVDQFCIQCHSPIAYLTGTAPPFFDLESLPAIVREGITCTTCHAMNTPSPTVDDDGAVYDLEPRGPQRGTLPDPVGTPAHESLTTVDFGRSSICLPCHNLMINGLRAEVSYSEWSESGYAVMGIECQDCHMPRSEGPAAVDGPLRQVSDHRMIGVDLALIDFPDAEENRPLVADLLARSVSAEYLGPESVAAGDSLEFEVRVHNVGAGHSIPSGASFLREMWLRVVVTSAGGDTLLASGLLDAQQDLVADPQLHTFQSTVELNGGTLTGLASIDNSPLIPAFGQRTAAYGVRLPGTASGPLGIEARVLFRSFAPATLRSNGLESAVPLIAEPYVMSTVETTVAIGR